MTNTTAFETVKEIVRNKVAVINLYLATDGVEVETFERMRHELNGMLICLKNINENDNFYNVAYTDEGRLEFGFYDIENDGKWTVIEG